MNRMDSEIAIGIDLGTTNSCVAYYYKNNIEGNVKVLENSDGDRVIPSFLFLTENNKVIVGKYAKIMAEAKPEYGVYGEPSIEIKRLIGRKFDDVNITKNTQYDSFKMEDDDNKPVIVIEQSKKVVKTTTPLELSAVILAKIKKDTEAKLKCAITKAVITVPAYFNITQREDTLAAAEKAGFTVLKLLNEPTAAALNYYFENDNAEVKGYSLVYDLGGGTFDIAILKKNTNNIDIIAVDGDSNLGGKNFDNLIVDYVCDELQRKYKYNPKNERRARKRLQNKCEEAKKVLSAHDHTIITIDAFLKGNSVVTVPITKEQFEAMAEELFQRTIDILDTCLKSSNINKSEIKEVILSGGSTRIPKIQDLIKKYFDSQILNKFVNPDECVAIGAALQAAMLSSSPKQKIEEIKITDVIPLSLGISDFVGKMTFLIKRNTPLPVTESCTRSNLYDKQKSLFFEVYEGERLNATKNRCLGSFTLTDVTPAPPGQCEVTYTMTVDHNGILTVTAKEKFRDNVKDLKIVYTRGHISDSEVKNTLKDAENHKEEDERFRIFVAHKSYVIKYCIAVKYNLEKKALKECFKGIYELCETVQTQAMALVDNEDLKKMKLLMEELETRCCFIVREHNFELMPVKTTHF